MNGITRRSLMFIRLAEMQVGTICCCMQSLSFLIRKAKEKSQNVSKDTYISSFKNRNVLMGGHHDRYFMVEEVRTLVE